MAAEDEGRRWRREIVRVRWKYESKDGKSEKKRNTKRKSRKGRINERMEPRELWFTRGCARPKLVSPPQRC